MTELEQAKARITELESTVLSLREALGIIKTLSEIEQQTLEKGQVGKSIFLPAELIKAINKRLTSTTPQANEIRERIRAEGFSEGVDECVSSIQQKIDGIDAIERGAFNGNLTDKAIYTRKAWKSARKALQSIKKEVV